MTAFVIQKHKSHGIFRLPETRQPVQCSVSRGPDAGAAGKRFCGFLSGSDVGAVLDDHGGGILAHGAVLVPGHLRPGAGQADDGQIPMAAIRASQISSLLMSAVMPAAWMAS